MSHMKDLAIRMERLGLVPDEVLKRVGPCECDGALSIANIEEVAAPVKAPVAVLTTVCRACQRQGWHMIVDGVPTSFVDPKRDGPETAGSDEELLQDIIQPPDDVRGDDSE